MTVSLSDFVKPQARSSDTYMMVNGRLQTIEKPSGFGFLLQKLVRLFESSEKRNARIEQQRAAGEAFIHLLQVQIGEDELKRVLAPTQEAFEARKRAMSTRLDVGSVESVLQALGARGVLGKRVVDIFRVPQHQSEVNAPEGQRTPGLHLGHIDTLDDVDVRQVFSALDHTKLRQWLAASEGLPALRQLQGGELSSGFVNEPSGASPMTIEEARGKTEQALADIQAKLKEKPLQHRVPGSAPLDEHAIIELGVAGNALMAVIDSGDEALNKLIKTLNKNPITKLRSLETDEIPLDVKWTLIRRHEDLAATVSGEAVSPPFDQRPGEEVLNDRFNKLPAHYKDQVPFELVFKLKTDLSKIDRDARKSISSGKPVEEVERRRVEQRNKAMEQSGLSRMLDTNAHTGAESAQRLAVVELWLQVLSVQNAIDDTRHHLTNLVNGQLFGQIDANASWEQLLHWQALGVDLNLLTTDSEFSEVPVKSIVPFKQGNFNQVYKITYENGLEAIFKPSQPVFNPSLSIYKDTKQLDLPGLHGRQPRAEVRNIAAHRLAQAVGCDLIPKASVVSLEVNEQGKPKLIHGLAMEQVQGREGRVVREAASDASKAAPERMYSTQAMKACFDLEFLDCLLGSADRHPGNVMVRFKEDGSFDGLSGIDNDQCLMQAHLDLDVLKRAKAAAQSESARLHGEWQQFYGGQAPQRKIKIDYAKLGNGTEFLPYKSVNNNGLPQLIDRKHASLLKDPQALETVLTSVRGLLEPEVVKEIEFRWHQLAKHVADLERQGHVIDDWESVMSGPLLTVINNSPTPLWASLLNDSELKHLDEQINQLNQVANKTGPSVTAMTGELEHRGSSVAAAVTMHSTFVMGTSQEDSHEIAGEQGP
jgi:hypothetical protein